MEVAVDERRRHEPPGRVDRSVAASSSSDGAIRVEAPALHGEVDEPTVEQACVADERDRS